MTSPALKASDVTPAMITERNPRFGFFQYREGAWNIYWGAHVVGTVQRETSDRTYFVAYTQDDRPNLVGDCFLEAALYCAPGAREAFPEFHF